MQYLSMAMSASASAWIISGTASNRTFPYYDHLLVQSPLVNQNHLS